MTIGTSVEWFPGTGSGSGSSGIIGYNVLENATFFQIDELKGKNLLSVARNNEIITDFSGYPGFAFNSETGTADGFPVEAGEKLVISYTKQ